MPELNKTVPSFERFAEVPPIGPQVAHVEDHGGNGADPDPDPFIFSELKERLDPVEREELLRRFAEVKETTFDLTDHHPILSHYYTLVAPFLDAKPQVIITPLLSAMAANLGNRLFMTIFGTPIFCNVWTIIMGPSSIARKTTSLERTLPPLHEFDDELESVYEEAMRIYNRTPEEDRGEEPTERCILLPDSTTERFIQILSNNPNGLIVHAEIASFLTKMNKSYNGDFKSDITEWFDTPAKKKHETMTRKVTVRRPCFSISTATTKEWLLEQLNPKDLRSGFMQRFLICNAQEIDEESINCRIASGKTAAQQANEWLAFLYNGLRLMGSEQYPKEVTFSEEAIDLHETVNRSVLRQIFRQYSNVLFSYWSRIYTGYFVRFCMLFTAAEHVEWCREHDVRPGDEAGVDLIVSEQTAAYALKLCRFFFENIKAFLNTEAIESYNPNERKILNVFYEHAEDIGKDRIVPRKSLNLWSGIRKAKDLDEALDNLIELGVLVEKILPAKGSAKKPTRLYQLELGK